LRCGGRKQTSSASINAEDPLLNAEADRSCVGAIESKQVPQRSTPRTRSSTQRPIDLALGRSKTNKFRSDQRRGPAPQRRGRSILGCGDRTQTRSGAINVEDRLLNADADRSCVAAIENKQSSPRSTLRRPRSSKIPGFFCVRDDPVRIPTRGSAHPTSTPSTRHPCFSRQFHARPFGASWTEPPNVST